MRRLEAAVPDGSLRLPETTFARALIKVAREYPPVSLLYVRANPQNCQYFTSPWLVFAGVLLEDFHSRRLYLREGMRAMEGYDSHLCYPDGGELQRDLHYNEYYSRLSAAIPGVYFSVKQLPLEVLSPEWERWAHDTIRKRNHFLIRNLTPQGQHPIGMRGDIRNRASLIASDVQAVAADLLSDPNLAAILAVGLGKPAPSPSFNSDSLPYYGTRYIRTG